MSIPVHLWVRLPEMRASRLLRYCWLRFYRLQGTPPAVAGGFAIGVFVGLTPTLPVQTPIILILTLLTNTSFTAGIVSSWLVCNPVTMVPLYYLSYTAGQFVFGSSANSDEIHALIALIQANAALTDILATGSTIGVSTISKLLAGSLFFAIPIGLISYFPSLRLAYHMNKLKSQRKAQRLSQSSH